MVAVINRCKKKSEGRVGGGSENLWDSNDKKYVVVTASRKPSKEERPLNSPREKVGGGKQKAAERDSTSAERLRCGRKE